jgi:Zn-dependent protease with chaperone function
VIKPIDEQFEAWHYDGRTPVRRPVTIELRADGLHGLEGQTWAYAELRLASDGAHGEPVRLCRGTETLVVHSGVFLEALRQVAPELERPSFQLSGWPAIMLACVAIAAVIAGAYVWGMGAVAEGAASVAPVALEERLGRAVTNTLVPARERCGGPGTKALGKVAARLAAAVPGSPYRFRVEYSRSAVPNAFAAPGGYIVVFRGLLEKMQTPEELAAVLAHEMEHVIHKHSVRLLARELSSEALLSMVLTDPSGTPAAFGTVATLANLRHGRADEEQADTESVALLAKARIRTNGLADLLRRLSAFPLESQLAYLSTHPTTSDRIQRLTRLSMALHLEVEPLMTASEWESGRKACAAE